MPAQFHDFAEKCREKLDAFEKVEVRCRIIGRSGSGKSSLINAFFGEKIAPQVGSLAFQALGTNGPIFNPNKIRYLPSERRKEKGVSQHILTDWR
jgi:GTPase SAR1 family protein